MQPAIRPSAPKLPMNPSPVTPAEYLVYSADEKHVGPVSAELIGRGVVAGKVPEEAYVAPAGTTAWAPIAAFPDIVEAMRTHKSSLRPSAAYGALHAPSPPPPPAVPRDLVAPAALAPALVEAAPLSLAPAAAEPKKEEKKEEKKPALDPKWKLLPVAIFGVFGFLAVIETAVVLIARR